MNRPPRTAAQTPVSLALAPSFLLVGALFLGGCNGAFVGNIVVLFVSIGIFFGTLNLGRFSRAPSATTTADQSQRDR